MIELEKLVGEPLEIFANGRLIAEGEAVSLSEASDKELGRTRRGLALLTFLHTLELSVERRKGLISL